MALIGIDIGGTFADIVLMDRDGKFGKAKVSATFNNPMNGIMSGVEAVLTEAGLSPSSVSSIIHGTTVATNAILEHRGAVTGLLTTKGFRDVLEIARLRRPSSYDIFWNKPVPLVRRALRLELNERVRADGSIAVPLDVKQLRSKINQLLEAGIESLAVSLLHAYANPVHEQRIAEVVRKEYPQLHLSIGTEVLAEIKEFERTSTVVVNAYIKPAVSAYLDQLIGRLLDAGITCPLFVMQSNGGIIDVATAKQFPVTIIESGPAAGVLAAARLAQEAKGASVIALDVGGTTAKASIVETGNIHISSEFEVGAGLNSGSRLSKGAGYPIRIPSVDVAEVGAGGGSIAWIDHGGALQVGPRSAGADPGPACYGSGGKEPTVTDANVLLGYMNPSALAGGGLRIDKELSVKAIREYIAAPLGLSLDEAAFGIHMIANANMIRAVRAVSTERGRDPREFLLAGFGGAGPIHACGMAALLEIPNIIIPPSPGLFSAVGLLFADSFRDFVRTVLQPLRSVSLRDLNGAMRLLEGSGRQYLAANGFKEEESSVIFTADLRYQGQAHELSIPLDPNARSVFEDLAGRFEQEHERTYGHSGNPERIELVNIRARAVGYTAKVPYQVLGEQLTLQKSAKPTKTTRYAYFGPRAGAHVCDVLSSRALLNGGERKGPLIVEEFDTTIVIPPGFRVGLDAIGNVSIGAA